MGAFATTCAKKYSFVKCLPFTAREVALKGSRSAFRLGRIGDNVDVLLLGWLNWKRSGSGRTIVSCQFGRMARRFGLDKLRRKTTSKRQLMYGVGAVLQLHHEACQ